MLAGVGSGGAGTQKSEQRHHGALPWQMLSPSKGVVMYV